ncbi:MAG: PIN domain-containing protein [bacterium]|nr:PIN domain-containing protein [bacterium]
MSDVLVDSSVWISFFRGTKGEERIAEALDYLLTSDEAVINEAIKSELAPSMIAHDEDATVLDVVRCTVPGIDWESVRQLQVKCLKNGVNKVGLVDLIIARDAIDRKLPLFTIDRHFKLIAEIEPELVLWPH